MVKADVHLLAVMQLLAVNMSKSTLNTPLSI